MSEKQDIVELQKKVKELEESNEKFRSILENIEDGYFEVNLSGNITYANSAAAKQVGRYREKMIGTNFSEYGKGRDAKKLFRYFSKMFKNGKPINQLEWSVVTPDGAERCLEITASPIRNAQGDIIGFGGINRDVTDRKRAEEKYRTILDNAEVGYYELDLAGNIVDGTDIAAIIIRSSPEMKSTELIGKSYAEFCDEENAEALFEIYHNVYLTGQPAKEVAWDITASDGTKICTEVSAALMRDTEGKPIGFRGTMRDVTERKKAEEVLRQNEEKYRTILDNSEVAYYELDLAGTIIGGLDPDTSPFGGSREAFVGRNFGEFCDEENAKELFDIYHNIYLTGQPAKEVAWNITAPDGTKIFTEVSAALMRDAEGEPIGFRGIMRDVTERKKAEEILRQNEEKYRTIFDNVEAGYYEVDLDGNITDLTDIGAVLLGSSSRMKSEELIGHNFAEFCDEKNAKTIFETYHSVFLTGDPAKEVSWDITAPNGEKIFTEASAALMRDAEGNATGFRGIIRDVTERKQAEEELRKRTRDLGKRIKELHCMYGISRVIERPGVTFNEILKEVVVLIPPAWQYAEDTCARILFQDVEFRTDNFQKTEWSQQASILVDGQAVGVVEVYYVREMPPLDEGPFQKEERHLLDDIAQRLGKIFERIRVGEDLKRAKRIAEEATAAKSNFLANMSHEIRTPMNAILGLSHLALQTELSLKQYDYLSNIKTSANSLLHIINDILDFSKIEAGKLEIESIDFSLEKVMTNLAELVVVDAQKKENLEVLIDVAQNAPIFLKGDPLRLGQVLTNLAGNAVKFTEEGEIVVSTRLVKDDGDRIILEFSVRDTGIGLSQSQIDDLFEAFSQADPSTTRKYGGTGLGLTICKRLVNMMGGDIRIESELGRGSNFVFTAEFGRGEQLDEMKHEPSPDLRGMRVLVIDDNATSREILSGMLESLGFEASTASSGQQGLKKLEECSAQRPYDLVLMDWKMPGMNGLETSVQIMNHPGLGKTPKIIMVTAYDREVIMRQVDRLGLGGFLVKPVSPSVLFNTIIRTFSRKKDEIATRSKKAAGISPEKLHAIQGAWILLVEDNPINQQVARELLEGAGLPVTIAGNGEEAVRTVKDSDFEAVLMDVQMPVMDGYQATREIRRDTRFHDLPIIAMTAHAMTADREKCLAVGMNDFVSKPIDPEKLFSTLMKWIKPKQRTIPGDLAVKIGDKSPKDAGPPIPDLPGISVATGLSRVGGNRMLYRKLLSEFGRNQAHAAEHMKTALGGNDIKGATRLAHTIKGVAGNIGAEHLHRAASDMEAALKQNQTKDIRELSNAFFKAMALVMESIASLKPHERHAETAEPSEQPVTGAMESEVALSLLGDFRELLDQNDTRAVRVLGTLRESFPAGIAEKEWAELENYIGSFAFEKALAVLSVIEKKTLGGGGRHV